MQKKLFNIQNVDIVTLVTDYLFNQFIQLTLQNIIINYICQFSFKKLSFELKEPFYTYILFTENH